MAIPILMYHNIAKVPKQVRHLRGLYVTPTAFARQMWLLHRLGYCCLSMSAAMPYLRGERSGKVMVVTLDDGYLDNLQAALPVLQAHGFSATCYVVSGSLARFNTWDAERLNVCKPLMSPAQVRQWHDAGMEVGRIHVVTRISVGVQQRNCMKRSPVAAMIWSNVSVRR